MYQDAQRDTERKRDTHTIQYELRNRWLYPIDPHNYLAWPTTLKIFVFVYNNNNAEHICCAITSNHINNNSNINIVHIQQYVRCRFSCCATTKEKQNYKREKDGKMQPANTYCLQYLAAYSFRPFFLRPRFMLLVAFLFCLPFFFLEFATVCRLLAVCCFLSCLLCILFLFYVFLIVFVALHSELMLVAWLPECTDWAAYFWATV